MSGFFNPFSILSIWDDIALNILSSNLLNSSKQPQIPTLHNPKNILPIDWKSNESSQQNTSTIFPKLWPKALIDSVLPVPAGPKGEPPCCIDNAWHMAK